ncbi:MerR family transcriptional regulator [Derxia lacustris]|uniref:hypothetical protein n=1 Tax=Derxia lacustris TaxID=764842 RepID=UPI00111C7A50|nr:hypothetical protein [Derxia lacustris]
MSYQPPRHPLEVLRDIHLAGPIEDTDPRYVPLDEARGTEGLVKQLSPLFGLDIVQKVFFPTSESHVLLFSPIGSGMSTELLRFSHALRDDGNVWPVLLNLPDILHIQDLSYGELLCALAMTLVSELDKCGIDLPEEVLAPLRNWFINPENTHGKTQELAAGIETSATPHDGSLAVMGFMANLPARFKNSSSSRNLLRDVAQKTSTEFTALFNELIRAAETGIKAAGLGSRLLFIVDGNDRIPPENARQLLLDDLKQLLSVRAFVLFTAPISLKFSDFGKFSVDQEVLPIVQLTLRDGTRHAPGWTALRELVARRIDTNAFAAPALIDQLIEYSGGHPGQLLLLLRKACVEARGPVIDSNVVEQAINRVAADFRYQLQPAHYRLLAEIDAAGGASVGNDPLAQDLLTWLALLPYCSNSGVWWLPNPAIRRLEGYAAAAQVLLNNARQSVTDALGDTPATASAASTGDFVLPAHAGPSGADELLALDAKQDILAGYDLDDGRNVIPPHPSSDYLPPSYTRVLLARGLARRLDKFELDTLISTEEAAKLLGTSRVKVNAWITKGRCIGLAQTKRGFRLPRWQFEPAIWDVLPELSQALGVTDGWALLAFLETPLGALDGRTPRDALFVGQAQRVIALAAAEGN